MISVALISFMLILPSTTRDKPNAVLPASSRAEDASPATNNHTKAAGSSYNAYKTPEERAAFIKQQAEQRMAERLAALGLRVPGKAGENAQARQEREQKEKEERMRQAEAEDAKREQERQRRLADEQITPPSAGKSTVKKPPPPPARKGRTDSAMQEQMQPSTPSAEQALKEEQASVQSRTKNLE